MNKKFFVKTWKKTQPHRQLAVGEESDDADDYKTLNPFSDIFFLSGTSYNIAILHSNSGNAFYIYIYIFAQV